MSKRKRRKELTKRLTEEVYRVTCGTHYHTTNKPAWDGYVFQDADVTNIRRLVTELRGLLD